MNTVLEFPKPISSVVLDPRLTDEEFEQMSMANELVTLERTREGAIIVNAPTGGDTSSGNIEISRQLANWAGTRVDKKARVFGPDAGFFLPDGSMLSPDAAYVSAEQMLGLTREKRRHFLYLTPVFVIELLSASDSLAGTKRKLESWIANGALLGWLIDPYKHNVHVYEAGQTPRLETGSTVAGVGPVAGFVLDLSAVWALYED